MEPHAVDAVRAKCRICSDFLAVDARLDAVVGELLQHDGEVEEPAEASQVGSSAMPHKRNPILTENLTGLARVVRSAVVPALENVALWHERDISHSSVERFIGPDACITLDFALGRLTGVIDKLLVYPDRMLRNLNSMGGLVHSQRVLLALTQDKGETGKLLKQHGGSRQGNTRRCERREGQGGRCPADGASNGMSPRQHRPEQRHEGPVHEDDLVLRVVGDVGELLREEADVQRVQHPARARRGEVQLEVARRVPGKGRHPAVV